MDGTQILTLGLGFGSALDPQEPVPGYRRVAPPPEPLCRGGARQFLSLPRMW